MGKSKSTFYNILAFPTEITQYCYLKTHSGCVPLPAGPRGLPRGPGFPAAQRRHPPQPLCCPPLTLESPTHCVTANVSEVSSDQGRTAPQHPANAAAFLGSSPGHISQRGSGALFPSALQSSLLPDLPSPLLLPFLLTSRKGKTPRTFLFPTYIAFLSYHISPVGLHRRSARESQRLYLNFLPLRPQTPFYPAASPERADDYSSISHSSALPSCFRGRVLDADTQSHH